jgi:hypothetical protein
MYFTNMTVGAIEWNLKQEKIMECWEKEGDKNGKDGKWKKHRPIVKLWGAVKLLCGPTSSHQHARFTLFKYKV